MTPAQARALLAAPELLASASADDLRVGEKLRDRWPGDLVAAATEQAVLRGHATTKFDRAGSMLFTRDGLEQATGEAVARHRARRFASVDGLVLDLCCGIGGDLLALSAVTTVVGVDRDELHALLARHNAGAYDVAVTTLVADVTEVRLAPAQAAFVDPARRSGRGTTAWRGGSSPSLDWCMSLPVERVAVKAAPGIDPHVVPLGWELEFVASGRRDLKEAVLWSPAWADAPRRATVLRPDVDGLADELVPDPATDAATVRAPGGYLLDPSPAVTRAGGVADLAAALDAWQIDPMIAFLSADHELRTPFGRAFVVESSLPFGVKALSAELRRLDIGAIDVRRRGLAGDVDLLRRQLRPTGSRRATVMLTRVADKPWAIVCTDVPDS